MIAFSLPSFSLPSLARASTYAFMLAAPLFAFDRADAKPIVEVGFVLDTTGSMGPLIEGAKRKIWSIATTILDCSPDAEIRMGLVAYRDIGDDYVTKTFPLTTDIQALYADLLALKARGGGDWPESVNEALLVGVKKLEWSQDDDVKRILFLVGDAPPHMDYAQDVKYPEVIRMARSRGIVVNAVQAGRARDTERVWREIAQRGNGEYIPIPQDGGEVVIIETPYDSEIIELQGRINHTILPYGSHTEQRKVLEKAAQVTAAAPAAGSDIASYLNKRSAGATVASAITGDGDLVTDAAAGRARLDALKDEELPETLRAVPKPQRQAYLDQQLGTRKLLNEKLAALVAKRDRFVAEARKKEPARKGDSFDRAVEATLRAQLKR